jgi:hypothetical protein
MFLFTIYNAFSDRCRDFMLTDGSETVVSYGIDTTSNWWIKTSPFSGHYRYMIGEFTSQSYMEVSEIIFSPDGFKWAFFAKTNTQWYLVSNDTLLPLYCTKPGFIKYTNSSEKLIYSYYQDDIENIISDNINIKANNRMPDYFFTSFNGDRFAMLGYRGKSYVININGKESEQFDRIIPVGFWYNGEFLYATLSGSTWEIKLGNKTIADGYETINDAAINYFGNCAGFLARTRGGNSYGILISDEYYDPLISKDFETTFNLTLHPYLPMMAFNATKNGGNFIIFSNTEYSGGETTSKPFFTHDGEEMYYFGCNIDCFINIGGRKYTQNTLFALNVAYSHKPNSPTIGYTSNSALMVRELQENRIYSGMMVDETSNSIYNWKKKRYEALGRISNKIYLLTCAF